MGIIPICPKADKSSVKLTSKKHRRRRRTRVAFSKIRKRMLRSRRLRHKLAVVKEMTAVELKSKVDLKKGHINFSNVQFPPVMKNTQMNKRKILSTRRCGRRSPPAENKHLTKDVGLSVVKIG